MSIGNDVGSWWRTLHMCSLLMFVAMFLVMNVVPVRAQSAPDWAALDAYVEAEREADRVPGIAVAITQNDQIVHMRGYGFDGTGGTVTPQTSFILGSMSTSFTALAVMQLVEARKIDLAAPVGRYLPEWGGSDPAKAQITVAQLLNHTSGIPTTAPRASAADATLQDHVRALADVRLDSIPGTTHTYASPNYQVLGAIVEQVSGQAFGDYVKQQIFTPLQMTHSFTAQDAAQGNGLAVGHRYLFGFPLVSSLPYDGGRLPTAALISSAEDLAHFLIAQQNGGTYNGTSVLSAAGVQQMHTGTAQGDDFSYAMGWRVGKVGETDVIAHGGVLPNYRGDMVMIPNGRWGVAVLTNISSGLPISDTSQRIADNIVGLLSGTALPQVASSFKTTYWLITLMIVVLTFNQLKDLVRPDGWQTRMRQQDRRTLMRTIVSELIVPVALLIGLPLIVKLPWSQIVLSIPDLGYWTLAMVALGLGLAVWKAVVARRLIASGIVTDTPKGQD